MSKSTLKIHVGGIDWQHDFVNPAGSLYVKGAELDAPRAGRIIRELAHVIKDIHLTLDQHPKNHIAHASRWRSSRTGKHPNPFTVIGVSDLYRNGGEWQAAHPALENIQVTYVETLARNGRYVLVIWPDHCLIGTPGAALVPEITEAINYWTDLKTAIVDFILKGSNPHTEHYSGLIADVVDPQDPTTQLNTGFVRAVEASDVFILTGQASSHCVANTVTDLVDNLDATWQGQFILGEDTMSPVPGFEHLWESLKAKYSSRVELWTSDRIINTFR
jgi:nicotinamidase-related amidase